MSIELNNNRGYISFLQRTPRKLPKVVSPFNHQNSQPSTRTCWLRWPFHRSEPLREEQMKKANVPRLKHIKDPGTNDNISHKHDKVTDPDVRLERRTPGRGTAVPDGPSNHKPALKSGKVKDNELQEVKRRPRQNNKCNDIARRSKRMSYPPCNTTGLHEYLERLSTKDHHRSPKIQDAGPRLSQAFSTSCPALYNAKYPDRLPQPHESYHRASDTRRHPVPSHHAKARQSAKTPHDQIKTSKHYQKGIAPDFFSEQHAKIHKNHVKQKVRKTKSNPSRDLLATRLQRPKPPSWQDQPPPSVTITEPQDKEAQLTATTTTAEKEQSSSFATAAKAESIDPASILDPSDMRGVSRRSGMSRSHLKRTRSRVIDTQEIPREDPVIPLSRTQQHEFHLKETHHDNQIYLTENARRCRKWLANLEVEDLRDENTFFPTSAFPDDGNHGNETITLDLEVSHERWNYLGSPYPSDSDSDAD